MATPTTLIFNEAILTPELSSIIYGSQVKERFRYELLNNANSSKGFLNCVMDGGTLDCNYLADVKRKCAFTIAEVGNFNLINFYTDRVKVYYELFSYSTNTWLSFPLGVYVLSSNGKTVAKKVATRNVEGFDLTQVLKRKKHLSRYIVPVGADPIAYARLLLEDAGIAHNIYDNPDTTNDVLKAERSYDPGSEYIATINDLLSMINYGSLFMDNNGIATSGPYMSPFSRLIDIEYITDNKSLISEGASLDMSVFDVPNIVQVVVSQPDRPAIVGIARNDNPDSPTSTVATGEERVFVSSDNEDVTTQDQANVKAAKVLAEMSQVYEVITFVSSIVPLHGQNTILGVTHNDLNLSAVFSETEWKIELKAGGTMTHVARRVVQL